MLWVLDLETEEQHDGFDRVVATIDKVTNEDVLGVGKISSYLEYLLNVIELTMYISNYRDGGLD